MPPSERTDWCLRISWTLSRRWAQQSLGIFGTAGTLAGGFTSGGGPQPLPSPDYTFATTIGDLANSGLQQQLTAGFDTELDNLLGDWGKLSTIGPLITDSSNRALLLSKSSGAKCRGDAVGPGLAAQLLYGSVADPQCDRVFSRLAS